LKTTGYRTSLAETILSSLKIYKFLLGLVLVSYPKYLEDRIRNPPKIIADPQHSVDSTNSLIWWPCFSVGSGILGRPDPDPTATMHRQYQLPMVLFITVLLYRRLGLCGTSVPYTDMLEEETDHDQEHRDNQGIRKILTSFAVSLLLCTRGIFCKWGTKNT
jgi:hypothetical protein